MSHLMRGETRVYCTFVLFGVASIHAPPGGATAIDELAEILDNFNPRTIAGCDYTKI